MGLAGGTLAGSYITGLVDVNGDGRDVVLGAPPEDRNGRTACGSLDVLFRG